MISYNQILAENVKEDIFGKKLIFECYQTVIIQFSTKSEEVYKEA
jgi:hypothetical protein